MELLTGFKTYLETLKNGPSAVSIKNYVADVRKFVRWFESAKQITFHPNLVTTATLEEYKSSLLSSLNPDSGEVVASQNDNSQLNAKRSSLDAISSSRSVERYFSSLRKFWAWIEAENVSSTNPFQMLNETEASKSEADSYFLRNFKNSLFESKSSDLTVKNYLLDVKQFLNWAALVTDQTESYIVNQTGLLSRISTDLIEEYKNRLLYEARLSPASINRKLSSLRKYLAFLLNQGLIEAAPFVVNTSEKHLGVQPLTDIDEGLNPSSEENKEANFVPEEKSDEQLNAPKTYSRFGPRRFFQKIGRAGNWMFDLLFIFPLVKLIENGQYHFFRLSGKSLFQAATAQSLPARLLSKLPFGVIIKAGGKVENALASRAEKSQVSSLSHFIQNKQPISNSGFRISNFPKEFYAPHKISLQGLPLHKKALHHLRHTRPNWYRKYHSYAITHYFHFALLMIVITALGVGMYNAFFESPNKGKPALAALPTAPPRILSFQGRLTDNSDNPITAVKQVRFSIYASPTATGSGNLLWQELQSVAPDNDGIFSVYMGNTSTVCADPLTPATTQCVIPSTLFSQNASLYLGITIQNDSELTPRQQLATVAYAANSETLQGLPPITAGGAGQTNVVLALDSAGNLNIGGTATPTFQASGGKFTLSGTVLNLTTTAGSNSNIQLVPDGLGKIDMRKALVNSSLNGPLTTAAGALQIDDLFAVNATSSGQSAFTLNQDGTGPLLSASTSGVAKFTIGNDGSGYFAGNVGIGTTAPTEKLQINDGKIKLLATAGNKDISLSTSNNDLLISSTVGGNASFRLLPYQNDIYFDSTSTTGNMYFRFNNGTTYALTALQSGSIGIGTTTPAATALLDLTSTTKGFLAPRMTTTQRDAITSPATGLMIYNTTTNQYNVFNGTSWGAVGGSGGSSWWDQLNGTLYPQNSTVDLLIGGQATSSAKFAVLGLSTTQATASVSGQFIVMPTNGWGGNVGIGTTAPGQKLDVAGNANLSIGNAYLINNISVLNSTTLGTGVLNSSLTSVGALASGSIASGFGTIVTANTITGTTLNGTTGINTGAGAGTQRIDASGNLVNIGTTQFNTQTYTWPSSQVTSGFLQTNGTGGLTWTTNVTANALAWSSLTNPTANLALSMGAYTSTFTYNAATGVNNLFNLTDTANNTGTGYLLNLTTASGSTLKPFHVSAAGVEALTVIASGNVGIGTTSPGFKLQVGTGGTSGLAATNGIFLTDSAAVYMTVKAGTSPEVFLGSDNTSTYGIMGTLSNNSLGIRTNNTLRMTIDTSGNVGIGTTSPTANLEVAGSGGVFGTNDKKLFSLYNTDTTATNNVSGIQFSANRTGGQSTPLASISAIMTNNGSTTYTGALAFSTAGTAAIPTERLRIDGAGNVGIGTNNPQAPLQIDNAGYALRIIPGATTNINMDDWGTNLSFRTTQAAGTINNNQLYLASTGNIGIGTNTPASLLSIGTTSQFQVNSTGGIAAATGIVSSGNIDLASLSAGGLVKAAATTGRLSVATGGIDYEYPLTFSNGLTRTANAIKLGGTLTASTDIPLGGFNLTFSGTGNVGIGTTTPGANLTVAGSGGIFGTNTKDLFQLVNTDTTATNNAANMSFFANRTGGQSTPLASISAIMTNNGSTTYTGALAFSTAGTAAIPTERMRIDGAGNVGIGTTTPGAKLAVNGDTQSSRFVDYENSAYYLDPANATTSLIVNGNVGIGTTTPGANLTIAGSGGVFGTNTKDLFQLVNTDATATNNVSNMSFFANRTGGQSTPLASISAIMTNNGSTTYTGALAFSTAGTAAIPTERLRIDGAGNVGIGTALPAQKLDVNGNIQISATGGALVFSTAGGSWGAPLIWRGNDLANTINISDYDGVQLGGFNGTSYGPRLTVRGSGNVGIGTTTPGAKLDVVGPIRNSAPSQGTLELSGLLSGYADNTYPTLKTSGQCIYFDAAATYTGYICGGTGFVDVSDQTLKTNIKTVGSALDKLSQIKGVTYNWKDGRDSQRHMGVLAQDVEKVAPELVTQPSGIGTKGVFYGGLNALTIEGVKELDLRTKWLPDAVASNSALLANLSLTSSGDLTLEPDPAAEITMLGGTGVGANVKYNVRKTDGTVITQIAGLAEAVIGNLRAGAVQAEQISTNSLAIGTNNITIAGQSLKDYIASIVTSTLNSSQLYALRSPLASTQELRTSLISPLASGSAVVINGRVVIRGGDSNLPRNDNLALEVQGSASISGQLSANELNANNASVSGTLRAGKIIASDIEGLSARIATLSAQTIINNTNVYNNTSAPSDQRLASSSGQVTPAFRNSATSLLSSNIQSDYANIASLSAQFTSVANLSADFGQFSQGLIALGPSSLSDTSVTGQLSVGGNLIIADNSINVLGADLALQPLKQGGVSIMGGLVAINTDGDLTVGGNAVFAKNVLVKGTLAVNIISPVPNEDLVIQLPSSQIRNSKFEIRNSSSSAVLAIDQKGNVTASGSGFFKDLAANAFNIVRGVQADTSITETIASSSAGTGIINATQTERTIVSPFVTEKSLIYITPTSDTGGQMPYVARQVAEDAKAGTQSLPAGRQGSFTVQVSLPPFKDIKFNWWIVN